MSIAFLKDKLSQYERAIVSRKKDLKELQDTIKSYERKAAELKDMIRKIQTGQEDLF